MYTFYIFLSNGTRLTTTTDTLGASPWYLLWTNFGVTRAYELIDLVTSYALA